MPLIDYFKMRLADTDGTLVDFEALTKPEVEYIIKALESYKYDV